MKISELRQLTPKKLRETLSKARKDKSAARFHVNTGQNQDTSKIKKLKKMIARVKYLLHNESQKTS